MDAATEELIASRAPRPKTSRSGQVTILVLLCVLASYVMPPFFATLSVKDDGGRGRAAPERAVRIPDRIGPYERLSGPEVDRKRALVLAGMAEGPSGTNRYAELFGNDGVTRFILQAMTGPVHASPLTFANEQRALAAGNPDVLRGAVDHTVGGITVRCDSAALTDVVLSMCLYAIDGFIVIGTGIDLETPQVASLVAEFAASA